MPSLIRVSDVTAVVTCPVPCGAFREDLPRSALEATQGQNDSFFSQRPYKCYLEEEASVGD